MDSLKKRALVSLSSLLELTQNDDPASRISIALRGSRRPYVSLLSPGHRLAPPSSGTTQWCYGVPGSECGDAHDKIHPKYLMAVLSSRAALNANRREDGLLRPLPDWFVPQIEFSTDDFVRRSMTLNGMRMTTEYFGSGSKRVLRLVEQRLEAGQRDVVHDILVYLANQIVDVRAEATEARMLRAEAIAAYLGLDQQRIEALFQATSASPQGITRLIESGKAGIPRRALPVGPLIESQFKLLRPSLLAARHAENSALRMIDRIVSLLY